MANVTPSSLILRTCFQSRYSLPYFQREYKWESKHFVELLNDIQSTFLLNFDTSHGRKEVASYSPYFLGSIITSKENDGKKPLIDGQQRLTSIFLILAFLERYRRDHKVKDVTDLTVFLGSVRYGEMHYNIEFSTTRKFIFDRYLEFNISYEQVLRNIEEIPDLDAGDRKILDAFSTIEVSLNSTVKTYIAFFIDYLLDKVELIDISVATESEAHRVFVTMNDRGLRLGPIELLKGKLLSQISDPQDSEKCHKLWIDTISKLRAIDPEEDSLFFRNLFRGKWANSIRGKAKGDVPGDFDQIGDGYHRWFDENANSLNIRNSDDYLKFARDKIPEYAKIYISIKEAETTLTNGLECIYYNAARRYSLQAMVILAATNESDHITERNKKMSIIAKFIDLILTTRIIENKENNYDNLKDISFALAKALRDKDYQSLLDYVQTEWIKYYSIFDKLTELRYSKGERSDLLYLLARISCFLESGLSLTNPVGFQTYWKRDRGNSTFDIEHLLKERFDTSILPNDHGFSNEKEYSEQRNFLGALALLPRSRNRSLKDKPYSDKLAVYSTESILVQTLCNELYISNPNLKTFLANNPGLKFYPISQFKKSDIKSRGELFIKIAKEIWKVPES